MDVLKSRLTMRKNLGNMRDKSEKVKNTLTWCSKKRTLRD